MLDAVHAASHVLRIMGNVGLAAGDVHHSDSLHAHHQAVLQAVSHCNTATSYAVNVSRALTECAKSCPFFGLVHGSKVDHDGTDCVCAAVASHVFKGVVHVPDYAPCDCFKMRVPNPDKKLSVPRPDKGSIGALLTPCVSLFTNVPQFHTLSADKLRSAMSPSDVKDVIEPCGRAIVDAVKAGHACGSFVFSDDPDGLLLAVRHMVVCEKLKGVYRVECFCKSSMKKAVETCCNATKAAIEECFAKTEVAPAFNRLSLLGSSSHLTATDVFLHISEAAAVNDALSSCSGNILMIPMLVHDSPQAGAQPVVDQHSGIALVDREAQISTAVALLDPVVSGAVSTGQLFTALIYGPQGTGKSSCGHVVLNKLGKRKQAACCMDEITCRNATTVTTGLLSLGYRMGKTLGVGTDTPAEDVLKALRVYLAKVPCAHHFTSVATLMLL
jgi:hypothetical protein